MRCLSLVLGLVLAPSVATAQRPDANATLTTADDAEGLALSQSSSANGSIGVHRIDAARALSPGSLVLSIGGTYSASTDLLVKGDTNERQQQVIALVVAPIEGLELRASQQAVTNQNDRFESSTVQILGDPSFGFKYAYGLDDQAGIGVAVDALIPTSPGGSGLKPEALKLRAVLVGTFAVLPWLELSLNAGYLHDRTRKLFKRDLEKVHEFTAQISRTDLVLVGLGVATDFTVANMFGIGPFVEYTGGFATAKKSGQNPMLASVGLKAYPAGDPFLELVVGSDVRITGKPGKKRKLPGLPPWEAFGRLAVRIGGAADPEVVVERGPKSCTADSACDPGQRCMENICLVYKEVIKEVVKEVVKAAPTFRIEGTVVDAGSNDPLSNAIVQVSGSDASGIAVEAKTGKFKSFPIPSGEGLVQLKAEAPGFRPMQQTIPRGTADEVKAVAFKLQAYGTKETGVLKGSLKNARTGRPIAGKVFVPALNAKIKVGKDGQFKGTLQAGRHQVLISSRGYVTQKKEIDIRLGDVVILNLDLTPKR